MDKIVLLPQAINENEPKEHEEEGGSYGGKRETCAVKNTLDVLCGVLLGACIVFSVCVVVFAIVYANGDDSCPNKPCHLPPLD